MYCVEEQCLACDETDDVEGNWRKLKKILLDSTEKVCGRTKGPAQRKSTWWWDGEKLLKRRDDSGRNGRMVAVVKRDTLKLSEWHGDKCKR